VKELTASDALLVAGGGKNPFAGNPPAPPSPGPTTSIPSTGPNPFTSPGGTNPYVRYQKA
jgi:hypothetical protein